jgi:hypothetical protein
MVRCHFSCAGTMQTNASNTPSGSGTQVGVMPLALVLAIPTLFMFADATGLWQLDGWPGVVAALLSTLAGTGVLWRHHLVGTSNARRDRALSDALDALASGHLRPIEPAGDALLAALGRATGSLHGLLDAQAAWPRRMRPARSNTGSECRVCPVRSRTSRATATGWPMRTPQP